MAFRQLVFRQLLPADLDTVWAFFSDPRNLTTITPPQMKLRTTGGELLSPVIYPGMILTYKLSPFAGITLSWMTEITAVDSRRYFVDEQRRGPYRFWHHQHHFKAQKDGVLMTDIVHYELPLGPVGALAHTFLVKKQLNDIFAFRRRTVEELFGINRKS